MPAFAILKTYENQRYCRLHRIVDGAIATVTVRSGSNAWMVVRRIPGPVDRKMGQECRCRPASEVGGEAVVLSGTKR